MMKFNFPVIRLSEHKIRSHSFINNIYLPGYTFYYDKTKSTHGDIALYINDKLSDVKRNDLISLDNNIESTFIEVNLPSANENSAFQKAKSRRQILVFNG